MKTKIEIIIEKLIFVIALVTVFANMVLERKVDELEQENNKLKVEVMNNE